MKYYFASAFERNAELRSYRFQLIEAIPDAVVTSRWLDLGLRDTKPFTKEDINADPEQCVMYMFHDLKDIDDADTIVNFTSWDGVATGKGGRHIEFGYALANGKRLVIIGPRENIFHTHPYVWVFGSFNEFLEYEKK